MDATHDVVPERTDQPQLDEDREWDDRRQLLVRRTSWALAWGIPLVALIVGIALASTGSIENWTPLGDDTYDVTLIAVWPAGLALLSVGTLGLTAAALVTAVLATNRESHGEPAAKRSDKELR